MPLPFQNQRRRKTLNFKLSIRVLAVVALAAAASFGALMQPADTPVASADGFGRTEVTFSKGLTTFPNMIGVVGGDVGNGTYAGEIITYDPTIGGGKITRITADYHLNGSLHQSTARVTVWQFDDQFAVITGAVTSGWRQGALVYGTYKVIAGVPGVCCQGTLYFVGGTP
jgi:hypothetical protein